MLLVCETLIIVWTDIETGRWMQVMLIVRHEIVYVFFLQID